MAYVLPRAGAAALLLGRPIWLKSFIAIASMMVILIFGKQLLEKRVRH
jgi:hypothetical protein